MRELARRIGVSHGWITRTEAGSRPITAEDVSSILSALEISSGERERLVEMAREADDPDWIRPGIPGVRDELVTLIEYERTATQITEVAPLLIPGLLQTSDYARAVMKDLPVGEREAKIGMRAGRRDLLDKRKGPKFEALIAEQALTDQVCGPEEQADQLRHLLNAAQKPNVSLHVLAAGLHRWTPMRGGHFMFFEFPQAAPIVHVEMFATGVFISRPATIKAYRDAVGTLRQEAMDEEQTADFISSQIERLEG
ncbi:transcriptional regulator with XRE-family HTH domain [Saccharopolyspora gloriosae]|uniref:Transcriptional regulator with XRE-family HTH domain n=1 Tax=Saccharopolyspora gloriosae TaxID=455344 RepID=A0A840NCV8_9PSEU|nr:transcriptional regulator with XRE-family HTH domain [Saccharopolyspora gloriosae]